MLNKYTLFLSLILLSGCSKDESVDLSNSVNIFQTKKIISFVNKEQRENSQLENLVVLKEMLNSKDYNTINSKINYPFKKKWQINTNQTMNDRNPYLPDPLFFGPKKWAAFDLYDSETTPPSKATAPPRATKLLRRPTKDLHRTV